MDQRYPIGKFEHTGAISPDQREFWIAEIQDLPVKLKEAVHGLTEEQLDLAYRKGGWSLRQVVHHLADSHMNSLMRFKLALTEDLPTIRPYYQNRWAELQDSSSADINLSLQLLDALHQKWVILLRSLSDSDFKRQFFHPGSPQEMSLEYCLGMYAWHGNHHIAHITRLRSSLNI